MTAAELFNICEQFKQVDIGIAYIRIENIEGERVCYLYDCFGEPLIGSSSGCVPLIQYAIDHGFEVVTLQ